MDFVLLLLVILFGVFSVGMAVVIMFDLDADLDRVNNPAFIVCCIAFAISTVLFIKVMNAAPDAIQEVYISNVIDNNANNIKFDKPMKITKTTFYKDWCIIVDSPEYCVEHIK